LQALPYVSQVHVRLDQTDDGDRLVVETDEPMFGAALNDLFFHAENGGYVKRFPRDSVTEAILARFEHVLLLMLRQTARLEPAPWESALHEAARRLDGAGVDWWLTGSGALAVRGLAVQPRDLDLVVSGEDAARTAMVYEDALTEPVVETEGWFCRWFGRAWLGARVEWVAGVTDAADDPEPSDFGLVAAAALSEVRWQGLAVRVPPIELQREVSKRRGLSERVQLIDGL
jgi:hypothetical protein